MRHVEADLPADGLECGHFELDFDPWAPTTFEDFDWRRTCGLETDGAGCRVDADLELDDEIAYGICFGIARTDEACGQLVAGIELDDVFKLFGFDGAITGEVAAGSLAATNVGHADSGQHGAFAGIRWVSAGTSEHGAGDALLREGLPEGNTAASIDEFGAAKETLRFFKAA